MTHSLSRLKPLLIFFTLALPAPGFAQMPPPAMERLITVSGEAEEDVAPDRAILNLSIVSKNRELSQAKSENDDMTEKLVAITREFKIPKEKVETSHVNISPEYNYTKGKREFIGYTVSRSLRITMDKLDIHERVLSAVVDTGIDQVNGVEFTLSDREKHAASVRVKAVQNAREKAAALATAAGAKLGKVMGISTVGSQAIAPPRPMMRMAAMASDMAESSVAPSLPGMITLRESVTVSFELE